MIGVGKHIVVVVKHEIRTIQRTGNRYVSITFQDPDSGQTIDGAIWLTKRAVSQSRKSLEALGFDVDQCELQVLDDQPEFLKGARAEIIVHEEEWQGQKRAKVRWINRPPPNAEKQKAELAIYNQQLREAKSPAPEQDHPEEPTEPEQQEGDVPF